MEDETRKGRIKRHFIENKKVYIGVGGGLVVGAVGVYVLRGNTTIVNEVAPVFNNTIAPVIEIPNTVNNGGHMRKIVRCLETDQLWSSVTAAAEAAETSLHYMSRHLNGCKDDVHGLHYVIEGLAAG